MIKVFYRSAFILISFFLFSCSEQKKEFSLTHPEKNQYADYFRIYHEENFSALVTFINANRTDSIVYILYKNDKPKFNPGALFVQAPVQKTACLSSIFVGFLNRLGNIDKIKAVDNMDFISNAMLHYLRAEGSVKELSRSGQLNLEETIVCSPNVIFTNPSGEKRKDLDERLIKAGIIPVVCADYFENHPLGRAEWIKAIALFFNEDKKADSLFSATEKKYLSMKRMTDTCKYKPTVFTEIKTNDSWFVSGGKSSLAQFLNDAGADYIWKDNGKREATALSMEKVIEKCLHADFWLHQHFCNSKEDLLKLDQRYKEFDAFKNGNLYNNNALMNEKGGNLYWEEGLCCPDEILADLVRIFHSNLLPDRQLKYYKQLK